MSNWQVQDAKARFSELLDAAREKGPQIVTRRGVEEVVLIRVEEWRRLQRSARPGLLEVLLRPGPPRFDNIVADRRKLRWRKPLEFE
jgi:prevent-host-death family protein